jgi:dihydrofolate reductase
MRKVVAYELLSLDGVAEEPSQFIAEFDAVMRENLARVIASQDVVILGRRTYGEWAGYWLSSDNEPFASFITAWRSTSSRRRTPRSPGPTPRPSTVAFSTFSPI